MKTWYKHAFIYSVISICSPLIMIAFLFYTSFISLSIIGILTSLGIAVEEATNATVVFDLILAISVMLLISVGIMGIVGNIIAVAKNKSEKRKSVWGIIMSVVGTFTTIVLIILFFWISSVA